MTRCETCWVVALCAALASCSGAEPPDGALAVEIVDSAGTQIVSSYGALRNPGSMWRVSSEPRLSLGTVDGDDPATNFASPRDATVLSDGRVVVVDGDAREIRWFAADGTHLFTRGGLGQGPGEFNSPRNLLRLAGDTVAVEDRPRVKLVLFDADGDFVDEERLDMGAYLDRVGRGECVDAVLPDLSITGCSLIGEPSPRMPPPGYHRNFSRIQRVTLDVSEVYPLGVLGAIEQWGVEHQGRTEFAVHSFHSRGYIAVGGDPYRIALASNPDYSIEMWTPEGRLERIIRRPNGRVAPTAEQVELADERLGGYAHDDEALARKFRVEIPTPDSLPAVYGLVLDDVGATWVRRNPVFSPDDMGQWDVFDPEGRYLGDLMLPGRLIMFEIGEDYILGVYRGEMDVPFVQLYDLDRS